MCREGSWVGLVGSVGLVGMEDSQSSSDDVNPLPLLVVLTQACCETLSYPPPTNECSSLARLLLLLPLLPWVCSYLFGLHLPCIHTWTTSQACHSCLSSHSCLPCLPLLSTSYARLPPMRAFLATHTYLPKIKKLTPYPAPHNKYISCMPPLHFSSACPSSDLPCMSPLGAPITCLPHSPPLPTLLAYHP